MVNFARTPARPRVLMVDDDASFTKITTMLLEKRGEFEVESLNTGIGVVEKAADWQPDIILLDYIMPGMNGGEVYQQLKSDPKTKFIPVILLTSLVDEDTPVELGLRSGRLTMAKPVAVDHLVKNIGLLLESEFRFHGGDPGEDCFEN